MIRARTLALAVLLLTFAALEAGAQQRDETVPRELVMTLLGLSESSSGPQLLVGRLPAGFPAALAPAGARVVGSLAHRREQSAVFALPQPCPEAAAAYARTVEAAGWTRPPSFGMMMERRGFLPAGMGASPGPPALFCQGGRLLTFSTFPREGGGSHLKVEVQPAHAHSSCNPEVARRFEGPRIEFPVPALYAPEGAELREMGMGTVSDDYQELQARLGTPMAPAELVAHYAAQLRQAGWTAGGTSAGEGVAVQTFARRDASGQGWHAVLAAVAVPGSDRRDLSLRITRLPSTGS